MEDNIPRQTKKEFYEVKPFLQEFFEKIFRYKLSFGLCNGGKIPSIINLIKDVDIMMELMNKYDQQKKNEEAMI